VVEYNESGDEIRPLDRNVQTDAELDAKLHKNKLLVLSTELRNHPLKAEIVRALPDIEVRDRLEACDFMGAEGYNPKACDVVRAVAKKKQIQY